MVVVSVKVWYERRFPALSQKIKVKCVRCSFIYDLVAAIQESLFTFCEHIFALQHLYYVKLHFVSYSYW